jgi:uncharacterized protein YycO
LEIKEAKERTQQELNNPSKVLEMEKLQSIAKERGIDIQNLSLSGTSVGTKGDVLVTLSTASNSLGAWVGGHAAIVSTLSGYTVESFGNRGSLNGVRHWSNDWGSRYDHVRGMWVKGASDSKYTSAASFARGQIGKPYNLNFFNKTTTSSYYCSQLVWRAWYNQGYDLDDGFAVWPVDLIQSPHTIIFYSKG